MSGPASRPLRIALTPGDPAGIGPEITWKLLQKRGDDLRWNNVEVLVVGAEAPFVRMGAIPFSLLPAPALVPETLGGSTRHLEGWQSGWAIQRAAQLIRDGECDALVTGPIHKARLQAGGWTYSGHTDFLADLFQVPEVTMMLANSQLRASLVTVHTALENVPKLLSQDGIVRAIRHTAEGLGRYWNISQPKIWVAALNPHAGEEGIFGSQEKDIIAPAIERARGLLPGVRLEGPLPADTLFARCVSLPAAERPDAVVAMYHDQGLIPVKLVDFARTVNLTLGLPIIRTSVDHGTAFDIAGKGLADASSLEAALDLAIAAARRSPSA